MSCADELFKTLHTIELHEIPARVSVWEGEYVLGMNQNIFPASSTETEINHTKK